jgi:hypothetical protein
MPDMILMKMQLSSLKMQVHQLEKEISFWEDAYGIKKAKKEAVK